VVYGEEKGEPFSHLPEIIALEKDAGRNDYKLFSFVTCTNKKGILKGI